MKPVVGNSIEIRDNYRNQYNVLNGRGTIKRLNTMNQQIVNHERPEWFDVEVVNTLTKQVSIMPIKKAHCKLVTLQQNEG